MPATSHFIRFIRPVAMGLLFSIGSISLADDGVRRNPVVETGEINGARFRIDIPKDWHGGLIVFAHGYQAPDAREAPPGREYAGATTGRLLIPVAGNLGYAICQSEYSVQGFALREGALESEALRQYFVSKYGRTYPTIIAGSHLGGLITYDVIERFPESYDGAIPSGGTGAPKLELCKEYMFDMRLLFDYYLPGLPGSVVEFPKGVTLAQYRAKANEMVKAHPEKIQPLLRKFQLQDGEDLARCVSLYSSILEDLNLNRAHGNAFDNRNTVYTGLDDDVKVNREIRRYKSDPKAVEYLRQWTTTSGRISDPVLAINALFDPVVPAQYTTYYAEACERAGTSHLFVQTWLNQKSPLPSAEEWTFAISALTDWIKNGMRPEPGELMKQSKGSAQ